MDGSEENPINLCGGYACAVDAVLDLGRALWTLAFSPEQADARIRRGGKSWFRALDLSHLPAADEREFVIREKLLAGIEKEGLLKWWTEEAPPGRWAKLKFPAFQPLALARSLLAGARFDHELRYFIKRNIRHFYGCTHSPELARSFHLMATAVNGMLATGSLEQPGHSHETRPHWRYADEFAPRLYAALEAGCVLNEAVRDYSAAIRLFVECCLAVGYLRPAGRNECVELWTRKIDGEYLLSFLFGMPTRIEGFDELFGGGGIFLSEHIRGNVETAPFADRDDAPEGRVIVVTGRFGSGKSMLSLQLAAEVAQKGGLAWVVPMEQSAHECLYALEATGALRGGSPVRILTNFTSFLAPPPSGDGDQGAIALMKTNGEAYGYFLDALASDTEHIKEFPLSLLVVDAINSVCRTDAEQPTQLRAQTVEALKTIKRNGVNVLLVTEESGDAGGNLQFEEYIADVVIRLSVEKRHGYAQRYFEILKSRMQREQRGAHPFSIVPDIGVQIRPSPAAVSARIRSREVRHPGEHVRFGLRSLDDILGINAIDAGDVIALKGSGGSLKTHLALHFLAHRERAHRERENGSVDKRDRQPETRALLVAGRDTASTVHDLISRLGLDREPCSHKVTERIRVCSLPIGHVQPGYILHCIEEEFLNARLLGYSIDRVAVDNIAHWELGAPYVQDDVTFGDTLVDLLRRQRVTSLLVCGEPAAERGSVLQQSILDDADCVIGFERFEYRGMRRVTLRVLKTRSMSHRRESFELTYGSDGLKVMPYSSLLRIGHGGEVKPVCIRMFLHTESDMQTAYNTTFLSAIQAVLSRDTTTEPQDPIFLNRAMSLGSCSAVDELQVLQLDEFQLGRHLTDLPNQEVPLYGFPAAIWDREHDWQDFFPDLLTQVFDKRKETFFAVPFYENISVLVYRRNELRGLGVVVPPCSWLELADACEEWEKREEHSPSDSAAKPLFFDFPRATAENYNCLFLEILLSLAPVPWGGDCPWREWLSSPEALQASAIFRRLCRRSYEGGQGDDLVKQDSKSTQRSIEVSTKAIVWRHWYTTLNQMQSKLPVKEREEIAVSPLPGDISMAGEWYLGLPAYSAAPDVGIEIIKLLTSHSAELDRLRRGVGLPTRSSLYERLREQEACGGSSMSPYCKLSATVVEKLLKNGFRRSDFGCYIQLSRILAFHLQRVIEIPEETDKARMDEELARELTALQVKMDFVVHKALCKTCRFKTGHKPDFANCE